MQFMNNTIPEMLVELFEEKDGCLVHVNIETEAGSVFMCGSLDQFEPGEFVSTIYFDNCSTCDITTEGIEKYYVEEFDGRDYLVLKYEKGTVLKIWA